MRTHIRNEQKTNRIRVRVRSVESKGVAVAFCSQPFHFRLATARGTTPISQLLGVALVARTNNVRNFGTFGSTLRPPTPWNH